MSSLKRLAKLVKNLTEQKEPHDDFLFMLNDTISRSQERRKPSQTFKPSSLGGCHRRIYFEIIGAPIDEGAPEDASMVGIGESGTARHEALQAYVQKMKDMGHDCEWIDVEEFLQRRPVQGSRVVSKRGNETKVFNDILNLSFMCDGIIKLRGVYYVLEIKTETSFKYQGRTQPAEKHFYQASCYSVGLGVDRVIFLYENRDVCTKKAFYVEVTDEMKHDKVVHVIETVNSYKDRGEVPPMTTVKSECKYCPFQGECKKYG